MATDFWDYATKYANLLYNITPHKGINNRIPNEMFYHKRVDLKYIKVFGCVAYYKDFSQNKKKFESNSKEGVFVGFSIESNCYMVLDKNDLNIHLIREVVFNEETPSGLQVKTNNNNLPTNVFNNDNYIFETPLINSDEEIEFFNNYTIYNEASTSILNNNNQKEEASTSNSNNNNQEEEVSTSYDSKNEEPKQEVSISNKNNDKSKNKIHTTSSRKGKEPMVEDSNDEESYFDDYNQENYEDIPDETIDDLASNLKFISVSNDVANPIDKKSTINSSVEGKQLNSNNEDMINKDDSNNNSQNQNVLKHKLIQPKLPKNKKQKSIFNESTKRKWREED
ncbi:hypothetical protein PIROE2DRAFT_64052 [Piromyces sp. E2]|nr:hypothetical protein PIROE2DRAFT_64052 [Piromyces sp. E2]|eukprot:OUM59000.1 hypothetical protein PIROE2DRAFT_64052 [Piromyces sp. E2]